VFAGHQDARAIDQRSNKVPEKETIRMSLEEQVSEAARQIATDRYSMSVGEVLSLYKEGEIDIHPDFQRFFRWSDFQKSRLVESLLLGLPIPPIFVSQQPSGKWELIDGLQRLSTLFELFGELKAKDGSLKDPLVLTATKYLPGLKGMVWDETRSPGYQELEPEIKLRIRRARIDINIVLASKSHKDGKFELFDRLNTGGTAATQQEVRNCLLLMAGGGFFEWLGELAENQDFVAAVPLTERQREEQYDIELIVRYLVLKDLDAAAARQIDDLHNYLTERVLAFAKDPNYDRAAAESSFCRTFALLSEAFGENAFRRLKLDGGNARSLGPFLLAAYEVVALGLGANISSGTGPASVGEVISMHKTLWRDHSQQITSVGKRASTRLSETLALGRELFAV
jgi:hypothetical protein